MGQPNMTQPDIAEMEQYGDMVEVGGPDLDPPVWRDITYHVRHRERIG